MSSMRNAVQRRNHKERAQPLEREKWGILEKHKDYSLRAKDFNAKKARLRILREKAAERNPDEFHFGMMSSKTDSSGRKIADRGNKALSQDVVQLLKTQDAGYLRTMAQKARKEREKLEQELALGSGKDVEVLGREPNGDGKGRHTVFVESREEQRGFDPAEWFETDAEGLKKRYNRPRIQEEIEGSDEEDVLDVKASSKSKKELQAEIEAVKAERLLRKRQKRQEELRRTRLEAARVREQQLLLAERELDEQRARMSNTAGGVNKNGIKWKVRERKR